MPNPLRAWGMAVLGLLWLSACSATEGPKLRPAIDLPAGTTPDRAALADALDTLREAPCFDLARLGVVVLEPGDGRVLAALNPRMGFMTASNMKLISSAVALQVLGPKFRYKTRLVGRGRRKGASFDGDLILIGSGDPTLGAKSFEGGACTAPFARMAKKLGQLGIKRVSGRVLGDDSVHPDEVMGRGWDWSYHADWYAAQVGGLCFNENCVDFLFDGTSKGRAPRLRLEPPTRFIEVDNRLRCVAGAKHDVVFARTLGGNRVTLTGSVGVDVVAKRDWGSVHNPTAFAATVLRETLVANGVHVAGPAADLDEVAASAPKDSVERWIELHLEHSPPMAEILRQLNKRSQNLYAEQVVRSAAKASGGDGGFASARKTALRVLAELGVETKGLKMADGSGLTRLNLVQPMQLAQLLRGMRSAEHAELYFDTLPIAGVDGTLKRRFKDCLHARGRVRAKTGYISRVVALSGYVPRKGAEPLIFSILVNDFEAPTADVKRAVDRFVDEVARLCGPRP